MLLYFLSLILIQYEVFFIEYKVRINHRVYDHMNTFIEDVIIGSHN